MRRPSARILLGATLVALCLGTTAARGEDWPQFRKDPGRTGASSDKTRFPVTDVWAWSTRGATGDTPTYDSVIVAGRVYFITLETKTRFLVCADAKTGTPIWKQPLSAPIMTARGIPAVSGDGKVFVYDRVTGKLPPNVFNREKVGTHTRLLASVPEEIGGFVVRAYSAATGYLLASLPIELLQMEDDLAEIVLFDGSPLDPTEVTGSNAGIRASGRPVLELDSLGTPLILGNELQAFTPMDTYLRWSPGSFLSATRIFHQPSPAPPEFWSFPPVSTAGGVLVANDSSEHRFMAVIGGGNAQLWHRELFHLLGLPSAEGDVVCAGLGKKDGTDALACFSSSSGTPRWIYSPNALEQPRFLHRASQKFGIYRDVVIQNRTDRSGPVRPGASPQGAENSGDLKGRMEGLLRNGFRIVRRAEVTSAVRKEAIDDPPGHESSGGVVVTEDRVFGEVKGTIVALDRASGRLQWKQPLPGHAYVQSLVGSPQHVIASYTVPVTLQSRSPAMGTGDARAKRSRTNEKIPYWDRGIRKSGSRNFVVAYQYKDGKKVWEQELLQPGSISLSGGLIYLANGDLTAYGPAERTYLVAEDSDEPKEYVTPLETEREPEGVPVDAPLAVSPAEAERLAAEETEKKALEPLSADSRADVSILRLTYETPFERQLEQVRDRAKLLEPKRVPLILQLDWLNVMRSAVRGAPGDAWTPSSPEFVARCARLAQEGMPFYFDMAPEVNVYLRRFPERAPAVLQMLAQAARAVRQASPGCQVVVTFNAEVLLETYGKGMVNPFDKLPKGDRKVEPPIVAQLALLVDAVGLSTRPYSGFRNAGVLPPDYLLRARKLFEPKPMLVTRIVIDADVRGKIPRGERAEYARRILQACYWLNARVVSQAELTGYPEMAVGEDGGKNDPIRLIAAKWQEVIAWPRVAKLTATPPTYLPEALDPEGPRETGE